jgi:two-component system, chemotaxis family, chemotaxis protein CheY
MEKRLLLVDDLGFMRTALREILEEAGMLVVGEAENGKEAVELYLKLNPAVVLMDITMPVMNGIEALRQIRIIDSNALIVMCSALGQEKTILRAIQLGAHDFVVKPFTRKRIVSAVEKALERVDAQ